MLMDRFKAWPMAGILTFAATMTAWAQVPPPATPPALDVKLTEAETYERCMAQARNDPAEALKTAAAWTDGGFPARHCAAVAQIQLGEADKGAQALETLASESLATRPALAAQLWAQAGDAWQLAERADAAQQAFSAALSIAPDQIEARIGRAIAAADQGQYWDAIDDLNAAHDTAPQRADIFIYRASAYRLVGSLDLALQDIQQAILLSPLQPEALLERGNIRALTNDQAGAIEDWKKVVSLSPNTLTGKAAADNLTKVGVSP